MKDFGNIVRTFMDGQHVRALDMIAPYALQLPDDPAVVSLHALILAANGRIPEAIAGFRRMAQMQPHEPDHWLNLGNALREDGQLAAAIEALETAATRGAHGVATDLNLGLAYLQAYRLQDAKSRLQAAVQALPEDHEPRVHLARVYSELGQRDQALALVAGIDTQRLDDVDALNHIGIILNQAGDSAAAERALRRAMQLDPGRHESAHNLASMLERQNRLDDAKQALAGVPPQSETATLSLTRARIAIRDRDFEAALAHFAEAERLPLDDRLRIDLHFDRGKVHDRLGDYDAAMRDFDAAHAASVALFRLQYPDAADVVPTDGWGVEGETASVLAPAPEDGLPEDPVFVVGFPRSGTTLLEQLLHAHPRLQSMDEQLAIESAIDELRDAGYAYPGDLSQVDEATMLRVRRHYWDEVAKVITLEADHRLVDKYPFNLVRLPFIARFFPNARIVTLLRHPADACLSCYMQKFRLNIGTQYWASLQSTTELYAQTMKVALAHAATSSLPIHTLRYEDLVADMPGRMRELLDFLGLPWDDDVLGYADKAKHRGRISTPSYAQVTEPINRKAVDRWRHYQRYLEPYLPTLAPYIERFGYDGAAGTGD